MININEAVFNGPQVRDILRDSIFEIKLTNLKLKVWLYFRAVVDGFLGKKILMFTEIWWQRCSLIRKKEEFALSLFTYRFLFH